MGDPRKHRKKYEPPHHPWQGARIERERGLLHQFGLKNKKEIWKMDSKRKGFADQAKRLIAATGTQADKERQFLFSRLTRLGLLSGNPKLDDVLSLTIEDIMNRRLQSLIHKKGLSRSMKQARQFITHQHIICGGRTITAPNYLVPVTDEASIGFIEASSLFPPDHPERTPIQRKQPKKKPIEKKPRRRP